MNVMRTFAATAVIFHFLFFLSCEVFAQQQTRIRIEDAWQKARENYPLIKQRELLFKMREYSIENATRGYLQTLSVSAQATYQSTVTSFPFSIPITGFKLPVYSKDQYRITGEINQIIYDGGMIHYEKQQADVGEVVEQKNLEVQLYALYDRVNQLFFGVLLLNEQLKQNALLQQDLQNGIAKIKAMVANGVALKSGENELTAQSLQTSQAAIDLQSARKAYLIMLGLFLNTTLNENTELEMPAERLLQPIISRPEILLYDALKRLNLLQRKLLNIQLRPRLGYFFQVGYGRPGLNVLSNDFAGFYISGLRASWNFGSLYTLKNQQLLISINNETIEVQKETFLFNTNMQMQQQDEGVKKYTALLRDDNEIIDLRQKVKQAAASQLENGVLSAHDYLVQVILEDQARQNRILHRMQLLQAQYNYQTIVGQENPR